MQRLSSKRGISVNIVTPHHNLAERVGDNQPANAPQTSSCAPSSSLLAIDEQGEIEIAGRRYVRQRRLATMLDVTNRTLARWNARGIGPPKITIGKTILFDLAKLPDWLATRETASTRTGRR